MGNSASSPLCYDPRQSALLQRMKPEICKSALCTKLFNSRPQTGDVHFVVSKEGQAASQIPAHKVIMAQASDVFQAMFYGHFETGSDVDLTGDSEIVPEIFEEFLKWIYLGELELTAENVSAFLHLAKKYMIDDLANRYNSNIFSLLPHAGKYEEIDAIFWDYVDKNTKAVLASAEFLTLSLEEMAAVVARDSLGIREVDVYDSVIAWATATLTRYRSLQLYMALHDVCFSENNEVGRETVRHLLGDAFYLVRFKQMHEDEFEELLAQTDYLFDNEKQIFSPDASDEIAARFESSPRTGKVPEYVPPREEEPSPPLPGYHRHEIVTKHGYDPDPYLEANNTIYLGNLPYGLSEEEFDEFIAANVDPHDVMVTQYKLFPARGFAFIEFRSSEQTRHAVAKLDGTRYGGRTLNCDFHKHRNVEEDNERRRWGYHYQ